MPYATHPCPSCSRTVSNRFGMCRSCRNHSNTGANNPNWRGGISTDRARYKRIQVERYPEKARARWTTTNWIRSGKIKREPCQWEDCGKKAESHHWTYRNPFNVGWFCRKHHRIADSLTSWWSATMSDELDNPTVYFWEGHLLIPDGEPFEMGGHEIQPVISRVDDPCFTTEGRDPGRPTRFGWLKVSELGDPIDARSYLDALTAYRQAIKIADQVEANDFAPTDLAAAWEQEREAGQVLANFFHTPILQGN